MVIADKVMCDVENCLDGVGDSGQYKYSIIYSNSNVLN